MAHALVLHPDRLLPADPGVRAIARRLYEAVQDQPIISPHGHVDPRLLLDDEPFPDPATLFVTPGPLRHPAAARQRGRRWTSSAWAAGRCDEARSREVWRLLCSHWHVFRGTPVRCWLDGELADIFGVTELPSAETADAIYDQIAERLATGRLPASRAVRAVRDRGAGHHGRPGRRPVRARRAGRRPDLRGPGHPDLPPRPLPGAGAARLGGRGGASWARPPDVDTGDYAGYVRALEARRRYFIEHGAVSADHSHDDVRTDPLEPSEAARIYRSALAGRREPRPRPPRSAGTCCWRWPGCRATTGW